MSDWQPLSLRPQIFSIVVVTIILVIASVVYFLKSRNIKANESPRGYTLVVEIYVSYIRNMVNEVLGPKLDKLTPLFVYLASYILLSNLIGVFGFENPTGSYTVTLSLALIMWIGVFVIGFKFQKLSYLKSFCLCVKTKKGKKVPVFINPIEVMSNIAPLISLSFRLWGNITAGALISTLWFFFTNWVWYQIPVIGIINILGGLTAAPLRAYFDLLSGVIQTLVFVMLTMVYWSMAKGEDEAIPAPVKNKKPAPKLNLQPIQIQA